MIRVFTAEFQQERKGVVKGFTEKSQAVEWAKQRIADESISSIALWELRTTDSPRVALSVAAEGKPWFTSRDLIAVVTRKCVRVMR